MDERVYYHTLQQFEEYVANHKILYTGVNEHLKFYILKFERFFDKSSKLLSHIKDLSIDEKYVLSMIQLQNSIQIMRAKYDDENWEIFWDAILKFKSDNREEITDLNSNNIVLIDFVMIEKKVILTFSTYRIMYFKMLYDKKKLNQVSPVQMLPIS